MPQPNLVLFSVKRKRDPKASDGGRWVEIGRCGVNTDGQSGFIEMHMGNETWRLFPVEKRKPSQEPKS